MTSALWLVSGTTVALLLVLVWALRGGGRSRNASGRLEDGVEGHVQYIPQIQQALSDEDRQYLLTKGGAHLMKAVERERRKATGEFLDALNGEFHRLLRLASIVAALSPEVEPMQEFERLRLTAVFQCRLQLVRARLRMGSAPSRELGELSDVVSRLNVRMESAMRILGERAALAADMLSAVERGDVQLS
jgi:hypothetical protein